MLIKIHKHIEKVWVENAYREININVDTKEAQITRYKKKFQVLMEDNLTYNLYFITIWEKKEIIFLIPWEVLLHILSYNKGKKYFHILLLVIVFLCRFKLYL